MFASTCLIFTATDFDAKAVVYRGACSNLTCVESADYVCGQSSFGSYLGWNSTKGELYYIQVTNSGLYGYMNEGEFTLRVDGTDAPLIQTDSKWCCFIPRSLCLSSLRSHACASHFSLH
jgi:hypothetical protein